VNTEMLEAKSDPVLRAQLSYMDLPGITPGSADLERVIRLSVCYNALTYILNILHTGNLVFKIH
jgi:hypothetical protein